MYLQHVFTGLHFCSDHQITKIMTKSLPADLLPQYPWPSSGRHVMRAHHRLARIPDVVKPPPLPSLDSSRVHITMWRDSRRCQTSAHHLSSSGRLLLPCADIRRASRPRQASCSPSGMILVVVRPPLAPVVCSYPAPSAMILVVVRPPLAPVVCSYPAPSQTRQASCSPSGMLLVVVRPPLALVVCSYPARFPNSSGLSSSSGLLLPSGMPLVVVRPPLAPVSRYSARFPSRRRQVSCSHLACFSSSVRPPLALIIPTSRRQAVFLAISHPASSSTCHYTYIFTKS